MESCDQGLYFFFLITPKSLLAIYEDVMTQKPENFTDYGK